MNTYSSILKNFRLEADAVTVTPWGEGHIHDTFLVTTKDHHPDYILQKINSNVFRNIPGMMANIEAVTRHIRRKLAAIPGHNPEIESLRLVDTRFDTSFFTDDKGEYWRMYEYIPDTVTYQKMTEPALAFEAGKSIGFFQSLLSDLETPLVDTIPDFHNIGFRIEQYEDAKQGDAAGRFAKVLPDIDFAEKRFDRMKSYLKSLKEKALIRATHNDTKVNNILFSRTGQAQCLIDLDTVMPGYVHFDYGDALRTMANTALEDEKDLKEVHFNLEIYHSFTRGYLDEAHRFLSRDEIQLLPYAPVYLTFIIGLRFLTDYLNGDIYYRVMHAEHNIERARVQFKLVSEMEGSLGFSASL